MGDIIVERSNGMEWFRYRERIASQLSNSRCHPLVFRLHASLDPDRWLTFCVFQKPTTIDDAWELEGCCFQLICTGKLGSESPAPSLSLEIAAYSFHPDLLSLILQNGHTGWYSVKLVLHFGQYQAMETAVT